MKGKELLSYTDGLSFESEDLKQAFLNAEISTICDSTNLTPNALYFCGAKKFLEVLKKEIPKDLFVIFSKKLFENEDGAKDVASKLFSYAVTENLPLSMSFLSEPFYKEVISQDNEEVDGRQMGTCEVHPTAFISQQVFLGANVKIGKNVRILPGVVIGSNSEVGEGSTLFPNVTIMPRTKIGKNCRIHSGTVIGSDGFGYNFDKGTHHKVWHFGGVQIDNNVEIGSNCSIDQGTFSSTKIGSGSKIDNQVQVGHNVKIGAGVIICGQVGLSGSSTVGDYSVFGGQSGLAPDCHVGSGCQVAGAAGVTSNIEDGSIVAGFPARPIKEWLKGLAMLRKLTLQK